MKTVLGLVMAASLLTAAPARAACPCYTASSSANTYNCAIEAAPGTNPTLAEWQEIFALVGQGPSGWADAGPAVPDINQGCGQPETAHKVPAKFPCEILKAIAMQESSWRQFCVPTTPADQVGGASRTLIAFDCGYGVGQVTSGMHVGEAPAFNRNRVASDATYNLATGTQILVQKWAATQCVGDRQPKLVEDWYTAVWAYNGLTYANNPNYPGYSSNRGVWNPSVGGSAPYQEKVFGWVEHPPSASHWAAMALAYPNLAQAGDAGSPPALSEPSCSSPTNCVSTRAVHLSACFGGGADGGQGDAGLDGGIDAGVVDSGEATPDAGATDGGGQAEDAGPALLRAAPDELGPAPGCGCAAGTGLAGAWLLALGAWVAGRRRSKSVRTEPVEGSRLRST